MELSQVTNGKLIKELEARDAKLQSFTDSIFALAEHRDDRFGDIIRANPTAKPVVAYRKAEEALLEAKYEAKRRIGPVNFPEFSTLISSLRNQGLRSKPRRA